MQHPLVVSVIIPVYHDWVRLAKCLEALEEQSCPRSIFEVIVINNDPSDVNNLLDSFPHVRFVTESKPGSYAARNQGIRISRGKILFFTDSDCIPHRHWIAEGIKSLPELGVFAAGHIGLLFRSSHYSYVELHETIFAFNQCRYADSGYAATANMIAWKSDFLKVGLFKESLYSCGDKEWGLRANTNGLNAIYLPNVVVMHPARTSLNELCKKVCRITAGYIQLNSYSFLRIIPWLLYRLIPPIGAFIPHLPFFRRSFASATIVFLIHYWLRLVSAVYGLYFIVFHPAAPRL